MAIATIDPTTGTTVREFDSLTEDEVDAALDRAARCFTDYRKTTFEQRAGWLRATADLLEAEADTTSDSEADETSEEGGDDADTDSGDEKED